ncbi:MAG: hypothetical protein JWR26_2926 [Pedosphaera sp.]|nr:hypothetical protein [Pedosphaera sp.]
MLQRCKSGLFGFGLRFGPVTGRCGHALKLRPKSKNPRSSSPHHFCQCSNRLAIQRKRIVVSADAGPLAVSWRRPCGGAPGRPRSESAGSAPWPPFAPRMAPRSSAAVHDVINGPGIFHANFSRHGLISEEKTQAPGKYVMRDLAPCMGRKKFGKAAAEAGNYFLHFSPVVFVMSHKMPVDIGFY